MDEITMFTAIRPAPPADTGPGAPRARIRLEEAFGAAGGRRRGSGRMPAGPGRFRFRRPVLLAGAVAAAAACAAIVVPAVLPAGGAGSLVTAAWAVQRNADGTVTVTVKDVFDLGGLQQALASDGVPARVITVATDPAAYTGPLVAADPVNRTTVRGHRRAGPAGRGRGQRAGLVPGPRRADRQQPAAQLHLACYRPVPVPAAVAQERQEVSARTCSMRRTRASWVGASGVTLSVVTPDSRKAARRSAT